MTFAEHEMLIQEWLEVLNSQGKSEHTLAAYRRALNHFVRWYKAGYTVSFIPDAVLPRHVWDWKAYQQTVEKAAPATINQRLVAVTRFFHWAAAQGLARKNPADEIGSVQRPTPQPRTLPDEPLRQLLHAAREHPRDYALLHVLAGAGLRVGELLGLRVGDVTLGERSGSLTVRKRGGERAVPLASDVRRALHAYLEAGHRDRQNPDAPLWMGTRGPLRHRSAVLRLLEKYAIQAGIAPISPDALRHTFAMRYLDANPNDLRGLARILGHASLNMVIMYTERSDDLTLSVERIEAWDNFEASLEPEWEQNDDDTAP